RGRLVLPRRVSRPLHPVAIDVSAHAPLRAKRSLSCYAMPAAAALLLGLLLLWLGVNFVKGPAYFFTISFIGLTNGAVYALVALGYTLVYGILELINFAHGDVFMLGGMISVTLASAFGIKAGMSGLWFLIIAVMLLAMICCGVLNTTIEAIAYRPLRSAPRLAPLITAIGVSFILEDVGLAWKGPNYVSF